MFSSSNVRTNWLVFKSYNCQLERKIDLFQQKKKIICLHVQNILVCPKLYLEQAFQTQHGYH